MAGKIVGVGWAKTGTTTLGECLQILGYKHVGGRLVLADDLAKSNILPILSVARDFECMEDWPWLLLFRELDEAFPGSRFILTTRDPSSWLKSYRNMLAGQVEDRTLRQRRDILYGFSVSEASDEQLITRVQNHNFAVREYFSERPNDLLEVDWSRGDGWAELCGFLETGEPKASFPHANAGDYPTLTWRKTMTRARAAIRRALG